MVKAVFGIIIMSLLMITSCTKTTPAADGSWTFKSVTYSATDYASSLNSVNLSSETNINEANYPTLLITFSHVLPTANGTYIVCGTAYPDTSTLVSIALNTGGNAPVYYNSTGGGGNEIITATVNSGLLTVSGSGIEMVNSANHSDSSALSFSVFQPN